MIEAKISARIRFKPVWCLVFVLGGVSLPAVACATDEGCIVDSVRSNFHSQARGIAKGTFDKAVAGLDESINFEEQGCINTYGLDSSSFSLSGLASGLLSRLKDAVCSAADNYVHDQIGGLGASIEAPLGIGSIGIGLDRGGSGFSHEHSDGDLDFAIEDLVRDQTDRLPSFGTGYYDGDMTGGSTLDDIDYVNGSGNRR